MGVDKEVAAKKAIELKDLAANTAVKLKETAVIAADQLLATAEELAKRELDLFVENIMFKAVFGAIGDGVLVLDQQGHVLFYNKAAVELTGVEIVDVSIPDFASHYHLYKPDKVTPWTADQVPLARAMRGITTIGELMWIGRVDKPGLFVSCMSVPLEYKAQDEKVIVGGLVIFREFSSMSSQYAV